MHDDGVTANRNQPDAGPRGVKTWHKDIGTGILPDTAILHVNIRGLRSHLAELSAVLRLSDVSYDIICINETFLDTNVCIQLEGFTIVGRRDRSYGDDDRKCGGIIVMARTDVADHVTLLHVSEVSERLWLQMHTDNGPYLLCAWYRPPLPGEVDSITSFEAELDELRETSLGTLLLGDLNLHSKRWLIHSASNSREAESMKEVCLRKGLRQMVRQPTRGEHLLDLAITDIDLASVSVSAQISDHSLISVRLNLSLPRSVSYSRKVWSFWKADWNGLKNELDLVDWHSTDSPCTSTKMTSLLLEAANVHIPQRDLVTTKRTHPWLTDEIVALVEAKREAAGTSMYTDAVKACSSAIMAEYSGYCTRSRQKLVDVRNGSKQWWCLCRELLSQQAKILSIPALKSSDGKWQYDPLGKAELLAQTFNNKNVLPEPLVNEYSVVEPHHCKQAKLRKLTVDDVTGILGALDESSGTGPDRLPARILKQCRDCLAYPILLLTIFILNVGEWPDDWRVHWIAPIFKRGAVFLPKNYRGVHLTAQLSKVVERLILLLLMPHISMCSLSGHNQFAYTKKKGSRDVLALLAMRWVMALDKGMKVLVYCSDVAGAFDRVSKERLLDKLRARGIHPKLVKLIGSWLEPRRASVVVGGATSKPFIIKNMVFQGTVLGPQLWNLFFDDARRAINEFLYEEIVYADDLNAYKIVPGSTSTSSALDSIEKVQSELHRWGGANQVAFDAGKESKHVLSHSEPHGEDFKLLGVIFDGKLEMQTAVCALAGKVRWKIQMLLRSQKLFNVPDLIQQYKQQVLTYIEYQSSALYHATTTILNQLDRRQD